MKNEQFISISQFAKKCNLSRTTVYKKLDNELKDYIKEDNGRTLIDISAGKLFDVNIVLGEETEQKNENENALNTGKTKGSEHFFEGEQSDEQSSEHSKNNELSLFKEKEMLDVFKQNLEIIKDQLDIKDKQIEELIKHNENASLTYNELIEEKNNRINDLTRENELLKSVNNDKKENESRDINVGFTIDKSKNYNKLKISFELSPNDYKELENSRLYKKLAFKIQDKQRNYNKIYKE